MALVSISLPDIEVPRLSNQALLEVSISLFLVFALAELAGALLSGSLSLLGDSVSMMVDVVGYICGVYVEWFKEHHGRITKWSRLTVEILIPGLNVLSLIGVSVYIIYDAVMLLLRPPAEDELDVKYLYGYATANLFVDLFVSFLYFFRGSELFQEASNVPVLSLDTSISFDDPDEEDEFGRLDDILDLPAPKTHADHEPPASQSLSVLSRLFFIDNSSSTASSGAHKTNLNMISAFMHVLGDTLRTIAMFVAALVSSITGIDGDVCDAYSAIIATLSILAICGPIVMDIKAAAKEVWEDESETSFNVRDITHSRLRSHKGPYSRVAEEDDDVIL